MKIPTITGTIDRRILINYQADKEVVERFLPLPFRPKLVKGKAIVGICLIRLKYIRPKWIPFNAGISSENGAHRIAVEWTENGQLKDGVYILRRDTSSRLNSVAGGRIFPGVHHLATFRVKESDGYYAVEFKMKMGHFCPSGPGKQRNGALQVCLRTRTALQSFLKKVRWGTHPAESAKHLMGWN